MFPGIHAVGTPGKPAVVMAGSGEVLTYAALEERSCRLANALRELGLQPGDHVAVLLENRLEYFEVVWAAMRTGLYLTTVNCHLTVDEAGYIIDDCDARVVVTSGELAGRIPELRAVAPRCPTWLVVGGDTDDGSYEGAIAAQPATRPEAEPLGAFMLYSSGTTGRPKGIKPPLSGRVLDERHGTVTRFVQDMFGFDDSTVYLSPAPLYHSAPLGFAHATTALGGTVVVLKGFAPEAALGAIERHRVTHSQWVPTMFVRLLKHPERERFDLSSHRVAIHAAAPCPVHVKQAMLDWWGPIIHEYYGGTEGVGLTYVGPEEWRARPGTVGRAVLGSIHVCDDAGEEVPPGNDGLVYFGRPQRVFEYHGDAATTRSAHHVDHPTWATLGDVGHVDEDGYLYLTDRATFMIVAGGVNIYPQEIEDVLLEHPSVADVAVFGVPNSDHGEEVKAVVEAVTGAVAGPDLADDQLAFASTRLARFKVPRSVDFVNELPRSPTGKLYKRLLRDPYWAASSSRIV